jgi:hypothetical protein
MIGAYAVLADRSDFRFPVLTCDALRPDYKDCIVIKAGLTIGAARRVCEEGLENQTQAELRLRKVRIFRARFVR